MPYASKFISSGPASSVNTIASQGTGGSSTQTDQTALNRGYGIFDQAFAQAGSLGSQLSGLTDTRRNQYTGFMDQAVAQQQGMGEADRARIYRDSLASRNSVGNSLANSGLYNTTVKQNMEQGVDRNRGEALGQLDEGLRQQLLQLLLQRAQGLDGISADNITNQREIGQTGIGVLSDKASYNPTQSTSSNNSTSYFNPSNSSSGFDQGSSNSYQGPAKSYLGFTPLASSGYRRV